jgi:predicted enzyme related to lactoylglutathione lyase
MLGERKMSNSQIITILAVDDLEKSKEFWSTIFEWEITVDVPVYKEFQQSNGQRLGIYKRENFALNVGKMPHKTPNGELTSVELYFHSYNPEKILKRAEKIGAEILSPISLREWGDEVGYFCGPEGVVIAVASGPFDLI